MLYKIKIVIQHLLPKLWLTKLVGWGAERQGRWLTRSIIMLFVRIYHVDMQEAQQPDIATYSTFNDFFVRSLRSGSRPINTDPNVLVLPADGILSQFGQIKDKWIFQAKGHHYSLKALLVGREELVAHFLDGNFSTTYLAPKDYHRVHMPCDGVLREMLHVPGNLFPVNLTTVSNIANLFARNERIICVFDTNFGPMAQILVGATIVGSIETVWAGTVIPPRKRNVQRWLYPTADSVEAIVLLKGQEMARFKIGSTVINLFSGKHVLLSDHLYIRCITRVGQKLAYGTVKKD
ncbi:archaetidylserine decarboxylase [Candidatus Curculioniphilus buchneri]|uniref:archaetidylserine decarboxylase n=1 Tax=Candidatus Curculioniphilus buchneri TaxID=690594 RepID=UPI00376F2235